MNSEGGREIVFTAKRYPFNDYSLVDGRQFHSLIEHETNPAHVKKPKQQQPMRMPLTHKIAYIVKFTRCFRYSLNRRKIEACVFGTLRFCIVKKLKITIAIAFHRQSHICSSTIHRAAVASQQHTVRFAKRLVT